MDPGNISLKEIHWDSIEPEEVKGETGISLWKEVTVNNARVGLAEYLPDYKSAEWCEKSHIIYCIEGELTIRLKNGREINLTKGNSLLLGQNDHHIAITKNSSAKIFVVD